jgi:hypothetical protein
MTSYGNINSIALNSALSPLLLALLLLRRQAH